MLVNAGVSAKVKATVKRPRRTLAGACLTIPREPRWQGEGADATRAARSIVDTMDKPCNAADAPLLANPSGPGRFPLMRRCRLLIGPYPTSSAPPCLRGNLPRSRPREILRQAPGHDILRKGCL